METRRIRRHERQRVRRIALIVTGCITLGVSVGMEVPRSAAASIALFALALVFLVAVAMRDESVAPLHGLHHVVRLPLRRSIATTAASYASRVVGSARALLPQRHDAPIALDEPDDEAEHWWGASATPAP